MKRFFVKANVVFFPFEKGGRPCVPVGDGYAPYLRSSTEETDLPIRVNGMPVSGGEYGAIYSVELELMYHPTIDYSSFSSGASFDVIEGPKVVANGIVTSDIYIREVPVVADTPS